MQDRVADLEAALVQVEAISKAKCNEMAVATAAEIQRVEGTYSFDMAFAILMTRIFRETNHFRICLSLCMSFLPLFMYVVYLYGIGEKKAAESALFSARAELAMTNQLKQQVGELQSLEAAARNDSARAQQHLASLATTQEQLHRHLAAARARWVYPNP